MLGEPPFFTWSPRKLSRVKSRKWRRGAGRARGCKFGKTHGLGTKASHNRIDVRSWNLFARGKGVISTLSLVRRPTDGYERLKESGTAELARALLGRLDWAWRAGGLLTRRRGVSRGPPRHVRPALRYDCMTRARRWPVRVAEGACWRVAEGAWWPKVWSSWPVRRVSPKGLGGRRSDRGPCVACRRWGLVAEDLAGLG